MNREERIAQDKKLFEIPESCVDPVLFYKPSDWFGCFSNFSRHRIILPNPWTGWPQQFYRTGEHRFQAMKAMDEYSHDRIVRAPTAFEAKTRGGPGGVELRPDWGSDINTVCWYVMLEVCIAKFIQHDDVQQALMNTGDELIYEDSPTDDIWGWRYSTNYTGKNLLGRCWMQVRDMFYR